MNTEKSIHYRSASFNIGSVSMLLSPFYEFYSTHSPTIYSFLIHRKRLHISTRSNTTIYYIYTIYTYGNSYSRSKNASPLVNTKQLCLIHCLIHAIFIFILCIFFLSFLDRYSSVFAFSLARPRAQYE